MVNGLASGQFVPKAGDSSSDFLISSCLTPCSPRPYPLIIDMMLAPWYVLLHRLIKKQIEAKTLAILATSPAQPLPQTGARWCWALLCVAVAVLWYLWKGR